MTHNEVAKLHTGDEVYWNDPDNGACSRPIKIGDVWVEGEVVLIRENNGEVLSCFPEELS